MSATAPRDGRQDPEKPTEFPIGRHPGDEIPDCRRHLLYESVALPGVSGVQGGWPLQRHANWLRRQAGGSNVYLLLYAIPKGGLELQARRVLAFFWLPAGIQCRPRAADLASLVSRVRRAPRPGHTGLSTRQGPACLLRERRERSATASFVVGRGGLEMVRSA